MPAARFWRVVGVETYGGGDWEISELQLYDDDGRADASATLSSSFTPVAGVLASINDNDAATTVGWSGHDVRAPGFAIGWDFGPGNTKSCTRVRVGSGADPAKFLAGMTLEYLDGSAWVQHGGFNRIPWEGSTTLGVEHLPTGDAKSKFWRLLLNENNGAGSGYTSLHEVQLFEGAVNVARGCTASASSYDVGYGSTPSNAVDGNTTAFVSSAWVSAPGVPAPHWLGFQLAAAFSPDRLVLWPENYSEGPTRAPKSFVLQSGPSSSGPWSDRVTETTATGWSLLTPKTWLIAPTSTTLAAQLLRTTQRTLDTFAAYHTPGGVQAAPTGLQAPYRDVESGGRCAVAGFTKIKGEPNTPFRCRVRLLRDRDALLVRETWSDAATGAFVFAGLNEAYTYTAYAQDHTGNYRAVVADRITPEVPA